MTISVFNEDMLAYIKDMLDITDESKDTKILHSIEDAISLVSIYVGASSLPTELEYVARMVAITRFQLIEREYIETENVSELTIINGHDLIEPYVLVLDAYKETITQ